MLRVVVTGSCGFLGAAFAARARRAGHDVVGLDADPAADRVCDIADPAATAATIGSLRPAAVVHLAAKLTGACDDDPVDAVRINALGTTGVFHAAERARVERVLYAGSNAAVGPCVAGAGDAAPLAPQSLYGATKAFGEHLARAMSARAGAPRYATLRFGWVYGPGRRRGWRDLQALVERIAAGERVIDYPDYADPIDWTYVDDAVEALLRALVCPLPAFAAVNALGDRRTVRDAITHLCRRFPDLVATPRPAETPPSGWGLINDGVDALLGALPRTPLEAGLDRLINASGQVPLRTATEIVR